MLGYPTQSVSTSIGVALSDSSSSTAEDLLRDADVAMYQAKAMGPGMICVYDQSMRARLSRATAEARLRSAIDKGEIILVVGATFDLFAGHSRLAGHLRQTL